MTPRFALTLAAACLAVVPAMAQAPLASVNTQLREHETKDSQLMWWLHEVTDVYGPRLTGSPGLKAAEDFAVEQMKKWGFSNVHLEAWNFNHPGWQNDDLEANVITPFQQPLNVRAIAWTPGTNGPVQGPVLVVEPPQPPPPAAAGRGGAGGPGGRNAGGPTPEELAAIQNPGSAPPPMPPAPPILNKPVMQADLDAYLASIKSKGQRFDRLLWPACAGARKLRSCAAAPHRRVVVGSARRLWWRTSPGRSRNSARRPDAG